LQKILLDFTLLQTHSHASLLINEGINIQEIARCLGHAKIEETWNTYAHLYLYSREEERAIKVLNKIVYGIWESLEVIETSRLFVCLVENGGLEPPTSRV